MAEGFLICGFLVVWLCPAVLSVFAFLMLLTFAVANFSDLGAAVLLVLLILLMLLILLLIFVAWDLGLIKGFLMIGAVFFPAPCGGDVLFLVAFF